MIRIISVKVSITEVTIIGYHGTVSYFIHIRSVSVTITTVDLNGTD